MKHILREKRILKYLVIFALVVTSFVYVTVYHNSPKTYAACNFSSTGCGYFNGQATQCNAAKGDCDDVLPSVYNGQDVTSCGEAICATNATDLEDELTGYVNTFCNAADATDLQTWEGVGAAFIMASMVEGNSGGGQRACATVFSDSQPCSYATDPKADTSTENCWVDAVNYYDSIGEINFNTSNYSYTDNTAADEDASYKYDINLYVGQGSGVTPAIIFHSQDGDYIIKHSCANPVGTLTQLQPPVVTISGYVQTYNGVDSPTAATQAYVGSCYAPDGTVPVNGAGYFSFPVPSGDSYCVQVTNAAGVDTVQINPNDTGPPTSPQPSCNSHTSYYTGQTASVSGSGNCAHNDGYDIIITSTGTIACTVSTDPTTPTINTSATADVGVTATWPNGSWVTGGLPDVTSGNVSASLTPPTGSSDTLSYIASTSYNYNITAGDLSQTGSYILNADALSNNLYVDNLATCSTSFTITPTGVTISGYVQTYNGVSVSAATQAYVKSCYTADGTVPVNGAGYFSFPVPVGKSYCVQVTNDTSGVDTVQINPNDTGPPTSPQPSCNSHTTYYTGQTASTSGSGNCAHNDGYDIIITSTGTIACTDDTNPAAPTVNTSATAYIYLTDSWASGSWVSGGLPDVTTSDIDSYLTLPDLNSDTLSYTQDSDTEFSASISAGNLSQTGSYTLTAFVWSSNNYVPDMVQCNYSFTNGVTISGYVHTYNGVSVSAATQAVIMYNSCSTLSGKDTATVDSTGYFSITIPDTTNFCIRVDNVAGMDTAFINPNDTGPPTSPQTSCTSGAISTNGYYPGQIASASGSGNCAHNDGYDIIITSTGTIACTDDTDPATPTVSTPATAYIDLTYSWPSGSWVSGGLPDVSSSGIFASMTLPNNKVDSLSFSADSDTEFSASISAGDLSQTGTYVLTALVESNNYNYVPDMAMCSDTFTVTPSVSCPGQNTKPTITLPQGNYPDVSGAAQGSGGESGTTTQPNAQYYQEVPGDWGISAANDDTEYVGSGTSISWAPTGYQSSNVFTLNYANYVNNYPYDPHTTTVTYNQRFTQTRFYSSSSPDGYTCNAGDTGGGSSSTCKHSYTGKKTVSGKKVSYTCNAGDTGGGSSSTCIHSYKGTPYYDWHAASATVATGSNTTYAGAPVLNECYARTFHLAVTDATVSLNGEEDNPTSITMSANVNATFGLSKQITAVHFPCQVMGITNTYIVSYITPSGQVVSYPAAGASTTFTYGPNGNCSGTTVTAIPKTDSVSMPPLAFGDSICLEVDVKPTGTQMDYQGSITSNNGLTSKAKSACATAIGAQPYVRVFGGDVIVGTSSDSIASCYIGGSMSGIESFNQGGNGDLGAGTTTSALATGSINGFASGQDVLNLLNPPPLTLANYPASQYGGDFATSAAANSSCGSFDYYAQAETSQSQGPTDYIGPCPTSGTIAGMTLGPNEQYDHYTCYSKSTVNITKPITYAIPSGTAVSLLPSFEVVVNGADINIGKTVGNLAGEYVAELNPTTNSGGTINDYGGGSVDICPAADYTTNSSQNTCSHDRLVIDGSFIANAINFYRTYGTLSAAANNSTPANCSTTPQDCYDAEEFDYSPLNWLEPGYAQQPIIQAITSLPPVL